MKKIYSAPQINKIREVKLSNIICTSPTSVSLCSGGEASSDVNATLSKRIDFSKGYTTNDSEW